MQQESDDDDASSYILIPITFFIAHTWAMGGTHNPTMVLAMQYIPF
jgi:hypothetical protein